MNFIAFESEQKLRGGFYTDPAITSFLVKWIKVSKPRSLLEPSCGDGAFLDAIEKQCIPSLKQIIACELSEEAAEKASGRTKLSVRVLNTDFLRWYLFRAQNDDGFDAVVGNPPFIRYQYLPDEQQLLAEKIFAQLGLPFTKHTNAWVPFVLASIRLLRPGGRIAMVIPSEIFHIPHAQSLRRYLAEQCSRILILDPEKIWFNDTLQGTVLLLAEKKRTLSEKGKGVAIIPVTNRQTLSTDPEDYFQNAVYTNGVTIEGKWMPVFLSLGERELLSQLKARDDIKKFSEIASVDVGIVTGANNFFLVPDSTVEEFALHRWAHPMFGRSDHVQGLVYSEKDHTANKDTGLPANFLWFQEEKIEELPMNVRKYLGIGLSQKLHTRFKCRTRKVWYKVPSVYSAPIAMLKRAHHYPRLVLNSADAYTTDTAYRIRPLGIKPEAFVLAFVNSLTCLTAEMEGRHYGGGVLELVPSEIERLLVPVIKAPIAELTAADRRFRSAKDDSEFLRMQDFLILGRIGLTKADQETLYNAWVKLRNRRHRIPSVEDTEPSVEAR
ncbi:MAG: N-6 DNA methylase [Nitrospirae bacterium]|nr:N-6 DNA methylase [Nitrospirota bacterium]